ncbi:hypothetical protein [Herbiconiux sp.]|uniref:hypothetical protein n=1 Tax=Herbiconiux sp. TaxID=1871186 RepID=UPI0025BA4366|nr:hypothetical protein [Herbiconiux sp.]
MNLAYTADTQIDAVVRTLPNCDVTLLTSYTSGEFWALTPERLAEFTYYDADFITLSVFGNTTEPPCPQPLGIVGLAPRAVLQCSDALYVYDPASSSWQLLSLVNAEALAANDEGPALAGISGVADCDGLGIRRYDLQTIPEDGLDISCVPVLQIGAPVALDLDGDNAMIWLDDRILVSADQGVTWNDLA